MSDEADFVDDLLMAGVDLNATDCRIIRDKLRAFLAPRSTSSPPAPVATNEPCEKCGREVLTVPVTHANGHPLPPGCRVAIGQKQLDEILAAYPPAPVDPVEAVLAVECPTCDMQAGRECFPGGGPRGDSMLCASRIRAAHHTATSEPRHPQVEREEPKR